MRKKRFSLNPIAVKTEEDFNKIKLEYKQSQQIFFKCDWCQQPTIRQIRRITEAPCMCRDCSYKWILFKKHGVTNMFQLDSVKEKTKNTMLKNYGVEFHSQSKAHWDSVTKTSMKKYGTARPAQSQQVKNKQEQTNKKKYKSKSPLTNNIVNAKARLTMRENYGCDYSAQNKELRAKQRSKYKYKNTKFDSSWELAYYIWLEHNNLKFEYQPCRIKYYSEFDKKDHYYFPDFSVEGQLVEIKSKPFMDMLINGVGKNKEKYECIKRNNVVIINNCDYYIDFVSNLGINLKNFKTR